MPFEQKFPAQLPGQEGGLIARPTPRPMAPKPRLQLGGLSSFPGQEGAGGPGPQAAPLGASSFMARGPQGRPMGPEMSRFGGPPPALPSMGGAPPGQTPFGLPNLASGAGGAPQRALPPELIARLAQAQFFRGSPFGGAAEGEGPQLLWRILRQRGLL